jgi:hypothetical protein
MVAAGGDDASRLGWLFRLLPGSLGYGCWELRESRDAQLGGG